MASLISSGSSVSDDAEPQAAVKVDSIEPEKLTDNNNTSPVRPSSNEGSHRSGRSTNEGGDVRVVASEANLFRGSTTDGSTWANTDAREGSNELPKKPVLPVGALDMSAEVMSNLSEFAPTGGSNFAGLPTRVDVLIIGAGPAGLTLACDLARREVDFRIIDMNPTQVTSSRAILLHSRSLEVFADLGLIDACMEKGQAINGIRMIVNGDIVSDVKFSGLDSQFPASLTLEQYWTEKFLVDKLNSLGHNVHRNIAVSRVDVPSEPPRQPTHAICEPLATPQASIVLAAQSAVCPPHRAARGSTDVSASSPSGVLSMGLSQLGIGTPSRLLSELMAHYPCQVSVKELSETGHPISGHIKDIRCRYIVGADGAKSIVRSAMEIDFVHRSAPVEFLVADITASWGCDIVGEKFHLVQNMRGVLLAVPMTNGRWRIVCSRECPTPYNDMDPIQRLTAPPDAELQQILDTLVLGTTLQQVFWSSAYAVNCRIATQFKKYLAFLIGDAAQVHPPTFGQGMNTGIQDAYNLGWKLAAVLNGAAPELLESYDTERRHAAEEAVKFSNKGYEQILRSGSIMRCCIGILGPVLSQLSPLQIQFAKALSQLDYQYPPSPIIGTDSLKGTGAIIPGQRLPDCRIVGLQLVGTGPEKKLSSEMPRPLQDFVRRGCHTLLLCMHVLPPGTKVRTLFGCERNQEAARWSLQVLEKLGRIARSLADSMKGVSVPGGHAFSLPNPNGNDTEGGEEDFESPDLRVVWVVCGLVDIRNPTNTVALGQINDHVPHRLKWYFTHGSEVPVPVYVAVDHQNELHNKLGLHLTNPDEAAGASKSGAALLVRPDGTLAYTAYAGDVGATAELVDYGLHWFFRCRSL